MKQRNILVTSALPYANGPLHFGHMIETIQTDIWVRFQRQRGHICYYVCGDDAHGTPIMLKAESMGLTPEALIEQIHAQHVADLNDFHISLDCFYSTHTSENQALSTEIYQRLQAKGDIKQRTISQAFDAEKQMFLPDRYVKGTCPRCKTADQYGDSCEACGATYAPNELIDPVSVLSNTTPIEKDSDHYFFQLPNYESMLKQWLGEDHFQPQIRNKLNEWFESGLRDWDISRDEPYFGFEIPDHPGKYFYVWMDAPIGYMAAFQKFCAENNINFDDYWGKESKTELYHFIGKDIVYFHALFWPAMLEGAGYRKPSAIFAHGFLTVNGKKMSKSRGTFINARDYLERLDPEYLRYYFAAKLSDGVEDIDLNFEDFQSRVNADLVGKVVNLASRCAGFIHKRFDHKLSSQCDDQALFDSFGAAGDKIAELYESRQYAHAVREIMTLADKANQYIDTHKPWQLVKAEDQLEKAHLVCSLGLNLFKVLITYLKPILPIMAEKSEQFLQCGDLNWQSSQTLLTDHEIAAFKPLMQRVDADKVEELLNG